MILIGGLTAGTIACQANAERPVWRLFRLTPLVASCLCLCSRTNPTNLSCIPGAGARVVLLDRINIKTRSHEDCCVFRATEQNPPRLLDFHPEGLRMVGRILPAGDVAGIQDLPKWSGYSGLGSKVTNRTTRTAPPGFTATLRQWDQLVTPGRAGPASAAARPGQGPGTCAASHRQNEDR